MRIYDTYKDSGISWLGQIPSHWELKPGFSLYHENDEKFDMLSEPTVLSLSYGNIIVKKNKDEGLVPENYSGYQVIKPDYIIIRCTDLQNDKVSLRTGIAKNHGIITGAYLGLIANDGFNAQYLHYFLHDWDITKEIYRHGSGLRQVLSWNDMKRLPILVPPLAEQKAIVAFLDKATAEIDKAIASQQRMVELLQERKQIIIESAVTKGIDSNAEFKDSGLKYLGLIPNTWNTIRLGYCSWIRARLGWKGLTADEYVDEGYPFLSAFNIINNSLVWSPLNFISKFRFDESPEIKLRVGDILLVKDGAGIGKCARVDDLPCGEATANGSLAFITPDDTFDYRYLYYFLISNCFKQFTELLINGQGVPHLTQEVLKRVRVPRPPKEVQVRIVEQLDKAVKEINASIASCDVIINKLQERKQILINDVVTGKIKVS